jgi:hypothetical protein
MQKTLFDIVDGWTLIFDRAEMEITLNMVSKPFYERKVKFLLLEDLWDLLEMMDDPLEFMTDARMSNLIEKLLRDEGRAKVARFVQIDITKQPRLEMDVLNSDETLKQFPDWFDAYDGITWDDVKSSLFD